MASIPLPALDIKQPQQPNMLEMMARVQQLKSMQGQQQLQQQQIEGSQQENQMRAQQISDQKAMTSAMQEWDGKNMNELPGLVLKHGGSAQSVMGLKTGIIKQQQDLANLNKDQLGNLKTKNDFLAQAIDSVKSLPPEQQPQAFESAKADAVQKGFLDPQQAQQMQYQGPQQLDMLEKSLMGHSAVVEQSLKEAQTREAAQKGNEAQAVTAKTNLETQNLQQFGGLTPQMIESKYITLQQRKNQGIPISPGDQAFIKAYEHNKTMVPQFQVNMQAGLLNDEAKQMAAENYAQTGQLPSGMRSPGMSAAILNTAAQQQPGVNIAANKAEYHANSDSLKSLQKNFDQVSAFENTAGKNLDVFLNQAKKVVDSGSPLINKPLRAGMEKGLGDADQAAFNAARTTAVTEIAKVLNSSNASGVLSDSARHEVSDLIKPGATLKQIYQAASILKQDMANRHQSYADQINDIKARIGGKQPAQETQGGGGLTVKAPNGKTYSFPDRASADAFKANAGIQ